ncbi:hypothetical protein GJAV_G00065420 [Gymnothorax javanicus]|nr:hypothetical protein GJAV_G00065420 [Gymnothorax javanicus]
MGSYSFHSRGIRKLSSIQDLQDVRFGHQFPRHGLKLLHWLAKEVIEFDKSWKMQAKHDPKLGDFGFRPFRNSEGILPSPPHQSRYFEVGNLNSSGAQNLPFAEDESSNGESNKDRIILRLDPMMIIGEVYITEHAPYSLKFSAKDTYLLCSNLIQSIKRLSLDSFLTSAGYVPNESIAISIPEESNGVSTDDEEEDRHHLLGGDYSPTNAQNDHGDDSICCNCCIIL